MTIQREKVEEWNEKSVDYTSGRGLQEGITEDFVNLFQRRVQIVIFLHNHSLGIHGNKRIRRTYFLTR